MKSELAKIIGNIPVHKELQEFPVFKMMNIPEISGGKVI